MGHRRYWMLIGMLVATACPAWAEVDRILGVESGVGVPTELTPEDVSALIGAGSAGLDAQFDAPNGNRLTGATEARKFEMRDTGGTNGMNCYWHSAGRWLCKPVVANVEGDADITVELSDGKSWKITNSTGSIVYAQVDQATGKVSVATIDCSLANVLCTVTRTRTYEFVGCQNGIAGHIWNTPATNAPAAVCDPAMTNSVRGYASFDDATDERIFGNWEVPVGYVSGSLAVEFIWKTAATSGAAGWCLRTGRAPDGTTSDPSLAAQAAGNCVSDSAKGTTLQENHATIGAVTCLSCATGDNVSLSFERDGDGSVVTDNLVGDAHLLKAVLSWKEVQ